MVKPVIFQVVGYQNSGKTTVIIKLIEALKNQGLKTVTLKHHGHGGRPEVTLQKDTSKHLAAGAIASLVEGNGRVILQVENDEYDLENQINLMESLLPDVMLIEGHKQKGYPKLLLLRNKEDLSLLSIVKNVKVIMYWAEELKIHLEEQKDLPCYQIQDEAAIIEIALLLKKEALSYKKKL